MVIIRYIMHSITVSHNFIFLFIDGMSFFQFNLYNYDNIFKKSR